MPASPSPTPAPTPSAAPAAQAKAISPLSTASLDNAIDPEVGGQLETAAAVADSATRAKKPTTAAGTPYANPGGRWNQFKSYSTFQRSMEIWGFAFQFAWRYFLLGQKWTYGKVGMTPEAVSARKKELAVWLREGLVRLGPT